MAASRGVSIIQSLRYRGRQGMVSWTLHRLTGLGIVLFVGMHVVAAFFLQQFGDPVATAITPSRSPSSSSTSAFCTMRSMGGAWR
jgi:succinate dehydrogenase/fumarate reductase cytochrome b subunit